MEIIVYIENIIYIHTKNIELIEICREYRKLIMFIENIEII